MEQNIQDYAKEASDMLSGAWTMALVTAGTNAGIFELLNETIPVTIDEIAIKKRFDSDKLNKWFYYLENTGIVKKQNDGYVLTRKGLIFTPRSPLKELSGLIGLNDFFFKASINAAETFQTNRSLDKLTEGEVTQIYQPKVSDNFSMELGKHLNEIEAGDNDSLLDVGCGNGSFLRTLYRLFPDMKLHGVDLNMHAVELGVKQNIALGIMDKIKLITADITKHAFLFNDTSFDWVTAVNVFHFVNVRKRNDLIDNMLRIAKKGVLMTQVIVESSPLSAAADPLMSLLWNDYTGFFRKNELGSLNDELQAKYPNYQFNITPILLGTSNMLTILKS